MFLTLLLVAQAAAEWVEISQQHYRKPMHTYNVQNPFTATERVEIEDTTKSWIYNNKSVTEHKWNKGSKMQSAVANTKRHQTKGVPKTEPVKIRHKGPNIDDDNYDYDRSSYRPTEPTVDFSDKEKPKAIIEKVSNVGSVKRVQLNNTPVKSPVLNMDSGVRKEIEAKNRYDELPLNHEQILPALGPKKGLDTNKRRIYVNDLRNRVTTEQTNVFPIDDDEDFTTEALVLRKHPKPEINDQTSSPHTSRKPTHKPQNEYVIQKERNEDRFQKVDRRKIPEVTEKKRIFTTPPSIIDESAAVEHNNVLNRLSSKQTYEDDESKILNKKMNDVGTRPPNEVSQSEFKENDMDGAQNDRRRLVGVKGELETKGYSGTVDVEQTEDAQRNNKGADKEERNEASLKGNKPENKLGSMENLLKIMKVVADTISQNTRRSFGGKMRYLHDLKNSILNNIAERIDATWPDDDVTAPHRHSRSTQESPRGHHVQFPSSESALMTISFLTFAVFLIKLVLQIIHTYKNKTMMVAPLMVSAAGRNALNRAGNH